MAQWTHHCDVLHGNDKYDEMTDMADIDTQIRKLYHQGDSTLAPLDQALIRGNTLDAMLNMTPAQCKQWLACVETAQASKTRTDLRKVDRYRSERQTIARWLHR